MPGRFLLSLPVYSVLTMLSPVYQKHKKAYSAIQIGKGFIIQQFFNVIIRYLNTNTLIKFLDERLANQMMLKKGLTLSLSLQ